MRHIIKYSIVALGLTFGIAIHAQQTRQGSFYGYNGYAFNPSYAGYSGCTEVHFSHLNQWIKIDGAPVTNQLSAQTRIGKAFGVGANLLLDKAGMYNQFNSSLGFSYGFKIASEHNIRLGLGAGYFQMRLDPSSAIAIDQGDVVVEGGQQGAGTLNSTAGILYSFKGLELSFATQQLIETRSNLNYVNLDGYGLKRHFNAYAAYVFPLSKTLSLKPNVFYKGVGNVHQLDVNADLNYNDLIFGGLGYRTGAGIVGRLGVNIRKLVYIAYAYEIPMQNIARSSSGSHEIGIGLKFCKKDKEAPQDILVKNDTITIVEHITDTLLIERIDTVYITPEAVSDATVKEAMIQASATLEFEHDKAIILKESYGNLESLTNLLLIRDELKIKLDGHTDNDGTEEYNQRLSRNRVEAVKAFFVANGIAPERIQTNSYGESKPISDNNSEEGKARNRRVEMEIMR